MLVKEACHWWNIYGDFPSEDERGLAPDPAAVLEQYRLNAKVPIPTLAEEMNLSAQMLRRIFHQGEGLDSIQRRRTLARRLAVPPELLGLDSLYWNREDAWWIAEGYHPFPAGDNGYPSPGAVVCWYREQKMKRLLNGKRVPWRQEDLGLACDPPLSEESVNKMENHGIGLDSLTRRRALAFLLGIPPALLGLDTAKHEPALDLPCPTPLLPTALTPDILSGYEQYQEKLFDEYFTNYGNNTIKETYWWITHLRDRILPIAETKQQHTQVCILEHRYHRLIGGIARQQVDYSEAVFHANASVAIAEEMGDSENLIVALYIRAETLREQGFSFYNAAQMDTDRALALIKQSAQDKHPLASPVTGIITLEAGVVHSFTAQLKQEREEANALLRRAERLSQQALGEVDTHILKLDPGLYHLRVAMALTAWHNPVTFKEHLEEATRLTNPTLQRRHLVIQIVRAQGEMLNAKKRSGLLQDQHYAEATRLATETLPIAKKLNSRLNRDRIQQIYHELNASPYGEEPAVAHLGLLLQNWP